MGFRINTNIDAMTSHRNMLGTSGALSKSLERLSSGLRINRAADDASGMTIADSLRAQGSGLGQAMKNAGDAISLVQVADGALDESINIVNTIRTKAIQAASDGQNTVSRAAIQADVTKLLDEMNIIADTTAYNGQTLLKGNFTNKSFQVGAYANQTVSVSIDNADASHVGRLATVATAADTTGEANLNVVVDADLATTANSAGYAQLAASSSAITGFKLNGVDLAGFLSGQGGSQLSAKGLAAAINQTTTTTNVKAIAVTNWVGGSAVTGGTIADGGLVINGTSIGGIAVATNDATGTLVAAINNFKSTTGVSASVDGTGALTLTATDGRNIQLTGADVTKLGASFAANQTDVAFDMTDLTAGGTPFTFNIDGKAFSVAWNTDLATTQADIRAAIVTAQGLNQISSNYSISALAANSITLTRTDGQDVNVFSADAELSVDSAAAGTASVVKNSAFHGQVTLSSGSSISVTGDPTILRSFGFNTDGTSTSSVTSASGGISDANVTTAAAAQTTIQRADSALEALDKVRSGLGSAQNQVEATLRNISVTRVNIQSAESAIRDVDFAEESSTFAKMNILVQAGSYALSQSNTVQQNIMTLLR